MKTGTLSYVIVVILLHCAFATTKQSVMSPVEMNEQTGEQLYRQHCTKCHGRDGTRGLFGAHNLRSSALSDEDIRKQLRTGKGVMPSFTRKLSETQTDRLIVYVKSLRKGDS